MFRADCRVGDRVEYLHAPYMHLTVGVEHIESYESCAALISSKRLSYCQNFIKTLLNCDSIIQLIKIYAIFMQQMGTVRGSHLLFH